MTLLTILNRIFIWLKQYYFIVFSLLILASGFYIWIELNPKVPTSKGGITRLYFADNISKAHSRLIEEFNALNRGRIEVIPVN